MWACSFKGGALSWVFRKVSFSIRDTKDQVELEGVDSPDGDTEGSWQFPWQRRRGTSAINYALEISIVLIIWDDF